MSSLFATDLILQNVEHIVVVIYWSFLISQTYSSEYSHAYNFIGIGSLSQKLISFQMIYKYCMWADRHIKCHLCTCSYACVWYFRHPFLLPLRGSSMLAWVEKQWVWSAFAYSPVQYQCSSWWHGPMRSFPFMSLLLAQFLSHFLLMTLWFAVQLLYF